MMTIKPDEANRILVVEAEGTITEDDIDRCADDLQDRFPQFGVRLRGGEGGGIGMLLDWERLEGWAMGARTLGMITGRTLRDVVRRVAIVADAKWRDEEERVRDVTDEAEVRFFLPSERDKAVAWLTSR